MFINGFSLDFFDNLGNQQDNQDFISDNFNIALDNSTQDINSEEKIPEPLEQRNLLENSSAKPQNENITQKQGIKKFKLNPFINMDQPVQPMPNLKWDEKSSFKLDLASENKTPFSN
jgi:hypothetical protein